MDTEFGKAIADRELYNSIVNHRSIFNKVEGVNYELHNPSTLSFIPPESIINDWEKDYNSMQEHFIYENNSLSFEELILKMKELTKRIRNI